MEAAKPHQEPTSKKETLTHPQYTLTTSNRYRYRFHVGDRAKLYVPELMAGIPDGRFDLVQNGWRYTLRRDGRLARTRIYTKGQSSDRQRIAYFYPVRIDWMHPEPAPAGVGGGR